MKKTLFYRAKQMSFITFASIGIATAQGTSKETTPSTEAAPAPAAIAPVNAAESKNDASYALGYRAGKEHEGFGVKLDDLVIENFMKGFQTAVKGDDPEIEVARLQSAMGALGIMLEQREKEAATANLEAGKKFLAENGKREGVKTLESGLQYEVLAKGGESKYVTPKKGQPEKQFMVNYKGTLIDGTEFDTSLEGSPAAMPLGVIEGLKEALTMMPVGAKWKLFIPSELAYGIERRGTEIAPNSVLIFELELVEIKDAPPATEGGGFPLPLPGGELR